ncbi:unnamed protein product, partial [Rotaria socialis]
ISTISIFADDFIVQYPMEVGQYTSYTENKIAPHGT